MEILEDKYLCANKESLDSKQVMVECSISLNQGEQIEKVLALSADSILSGMEYFEKETKCTGEIFTTLMYMTPEGEVNSLSATNVFSESFKHDVLQAGQKTKLDAKVVSVTVQSANETAFRVQVGVELSLGVEGNSAIEAYQNTDEVNCVKENNLTLNVLKQDLSGTFACEKEVFVKDKIKKVLVVDSSAVLTDTSCGVGYVSVEGNVYTYLVYVKEDGTLVHAQVSQSFKEELEATNATKESMLETYIEAKKAETTAVLEEKEDGCNVVVTTQLKAYVKVYENQEFNCVADIYSLTNELEVVKQNFSNVKLISPKYFEGKVEGNLTLTESQPRIDKVLTVSAPRLSVSNYYVQNGEIFVEGIAWANVIYLNDEENSVNSVEIEVPFSTSEKLSTEIADLSSKVQVALCDCDVIAKRGREIYFDCKAKVWANLWYTQSKEIITNVIKGRTFAERDSAIEIYFAKSGDSVWDIAKELKVSEQVIMSQNPTITSPLENDEKVVIYFGIE